MTRKKLLLVTRPQHQADKLITSLEKQGYACVTFPCLEITEPSDYHPVNDALRHFSKFDVCIFTSANAVLPLFQHHLKITPSLFAIGHATAEQLASYVQHVINIPERHSSEGLLAHPQLQSVNGLTIAIFTGENSTTLLQDTLLLRGANVITIPCYARRCPQYTREHIDAIAKRNYDSIIVTSNAILRNLIDLLKPHEPWLKHQPLWVTSTTIQSEAEFQGFHNISFHNPTFLKPN